MLLLPKKVGNYTLLRKLGTGGIAESYVGSHDAQSGRPVVVRRILPFVLRDPGRLSAIESRIDDLLGVRHPFLVHLAEHVVVGDDHFLVEEYVDGVTLDRVLAWCRQNQRPLPHNVFLNIATQVCNGLEALHGRPGKVSGAENVLHLALKPGAVFITRDGKVMVGSYGLTRSPTTLPQGGGAVPARLEYLSPEQTQPDQKLTPASDIFSLGSILYELLTGDSLFRAESNLQTIHKVRRAEVTSQLLRVKEVMPGLDKILYRALSLNPKHRYQRAFVLREDLRGLMAGYSFAAISDDTRVFLGPLLESLQPAPVGGLAAAQDAPADADRFDDTGETRIDPDPMTTAAITAKALAERAARERSQLMLVTLDEHADHTETTEHTSPRPAEVDPPTVLQPEAAVPSAEDRDRPTIPGTESHAGDVLTRNLAVAVPRGVPVPDASQGRGVPLDSLRHQPPVENTSFEGLRLETPARAAAGSPSLPPPARAEAPPPPRIEAAAPPRVEPSPPPRTVPPPASVTAAPPPVVEPEPRPAPPPAGFSRPMPGPGGVSRPVPPPAARPAAPPPPPVVSPRPAEPRAAEVIPLNPTRPAGPVAGVPPLQAVPPLDEPLDPPRSSRGGLIVGIAAVVALVAVVGCSGAAWLGYSWWSSRQVETLAAGTPTLDEDALAILADAAPPQLAPIDDDAADVLAGQDPAPEVAPPAAPPAEVEPAPPAADPFEAPPPRAPAERAPPSDDRFLYEPAPARAPDRVATRSEPEVATSSTPTYRSSTTPTRTPTVYTPPPEEPVVADAAIEPLIEELPVSSIEQYAEPARKGKLDGAGISELEAIGTSDPQYNRSRALLLMNAQRKGDDKGQRKYLDQLMLLPENQYNPVYLTDYARWYVNHGDYDRALEKAQLAERHWARLPSELVFSKKAEIYEIEAAAWQGKFYTSDGDLDLLQNAIKNWQRYRSHVTTKQRQDLAQRADTQLAKLEDIRQRLE